MWTLIFDGISSNSNIGTITLLIRSPVAITDN